MLFRSITGLVGSNAGRDHGTADTAGPSQRHLARHIDVRHVLVLGEEREMQEDGERRRVGREDHELRDTAVKRLGRCKLCQFMLAVCGRF